MVMRPERAQRLADWLRKLADQEIDTASVLTKLEHGNPEPCRTKARLFREIADTLFVLPEPPAEPIQAVQTPEGDILPPDPEKPLTGRRRAPL
jgi:hypothetical protein